jgi:hypothetical protein
MNDASRIGCHCWGSSEASVAGLPVAAEVGCRWVRATRPMQMDHVLVAPGRYDFSGRGEKSVDLALAHGMSVMGILDARWGNETGLNMLGFCSPVWEHLEVWEDFVRQAVAFYRGRVRHWEVLNEPPFFWWHPTAPGVRMPEKNPPLRRAPLRHYVALLKASARAIRETDPVAKVVLGAGFPDGAFLRRMYELGARDDFDIASVHYLSCRHPDDFARGHRLLRGVMEANGDAHKPLWDTENGPHGAVIDQWVKTPAEYEALFNVYRHCFAHECGLERYFWFNSEPGRRNAAGGLAAPYRAMKNLHAFLGERRLLGTRHDGGEAHLYVFEGPVSILWATAPARARLSGGKVTATTHLGEEVTLDGEFDLTGAPLFVRADLRGELEFTVTGRREAVIVSMKEPSAEVPFLRVTRKGVRVAVPAAETSDHFCRVPTSVTGELEVAFDEKAMKLRARLDGGGETGLVQFSLRDRDPSVAEWGYFTGGTALISLFVGREGPMVLRHESLRPDLYPPGRVARARIEVRGGEICAEIPWEEIGPCRPGRHEPFLLQATLCRADHLLDTEEPSEAPHNFVDPFIVKRPALARWLTFL